MRYSRENFGAKIFYLFTLFILAVCVAFTAFFIYYQSNTLKENLISDGEQLSKLLAYNARLGVFAENETLLKDHIEGIMQNENVMMVQVFTSDGKELITRKKYVQDSRGKVMEKEMENPETTFKKLRETRSDLYYESYDKIEFWAAVISRAAYQVEEAWFFGEDLSPRKDPTIGFVRLVLSTELLHKKLRDLLLKSILIPVIFIIPGWLIALLIVKGITKPLSSLTEGVKAIGTGDAVEPISIETKDEIGKLAAAFNNMAQSLKKREEEKQQLEEQLRQAQKMEAIGTLAGGIAHDFNNILTGIIGYGHLLQKKVSKEDRAKQQYLEQLLSSAGRAAVLTQSLLAFSRKQVINPQPVKLNEIVKRVEKLLSRLIGEDIEMKTVYSEKDITVVADSGQIEQVLMNLATNARDAMPDGGQLIIKTELVELDDDYSRSFADDDTGKYALISVSDNGAGMDEKTRERIFEPFFTTKDPGRGTGLGLSIVYGIIKQHNGFIDVQSEPGKGTAFNIYLRSVETEMETRKLDDLPDAGFFAVEGSETLLIAEDDEHVRRLVTHILKQAGYKVIEARDGKEAVKKFIENKDKVNFLVLDVIMPKKNGKEAYDEIRKIKPDVKALFMSGYTSEVIHKKGILDEGINFIAKPVSPDELLRKIREILNKTG